MHVTRDVTGLQNRTGVTVYPVVNRNPFVQDVPPSSKLYSKPTTPFATRGDSCDRPAIALLGRGGRSGGLQPPGGRSRNYVVWRALYSLSSSAIPRAQVGEASRWRYRGSTRLATRSMSQSFIGCQTARSSWFPACARM